MKIIVAIAFLLIIGSLASALLFLMRDKGKSNRTVYALTLRVGFSVLLFVLLLIAYKFGLIQPTVRTSRTYSQYTTTYKPSQTTSTK
eukprot:gene22900-24205_t